MTPTLQRIRSRNAGVGSRMPHCEMRDPTPLRVQGLVLVLVLVLAFGAGLVPAAQAAGGAPRWVPVSVAGGASVIRVPVDRFELIGTVSGGGSADAAGAIRASGTGASGANASGAGVSGAATASASLTTRDLERWLRDNRPDIGSVGGLDTAQTSLLARRLVSPVHLVVGRYAVDSAELAIDVLRIEGGRDGRGAPRFSVSRAPFTPHHGRRWAAQRAYLTAAERQADGQGPGRNPFAAHAGREDDALFHHINAAGVQVALGHAMLLYRAPTALLSATTINPTVSQVRSGSWLRRRVTTTVTGTALTRWYVATPLAAQPWADPVAVCVASPPCEDAACSVRAACPAEWVAASGVAIAAAPGGAFADTEALIYSATTTRRGWTLLSVGLLLDPGFFGAAALNAGITGIGRTSLTGLVSGSGAPRIASAAGGGELAVGPDANGALTDAQLGRFTDAPASAWQPPAVDDADGRAMIELARRRALAELSTAAPAAAASEANAEANAGATSAAGSAATTAAQPVLLPAVRQVWNEASRADAAALSNAAMAAQAQDAAEHLRACRLQGLEGAALRRCAAGQRGGPLGAP